MSMLKELVDILQPFAEATDVAQSEKYASTGCIIPCVIGLFNYQKHFQQINKYHSPVHWWNHYISDLAAYWQMLACLMTRWIKVSTDWLYPSASLMDPTYGFIWLEDDLAIDDIMKQDVLSHIKTTWTARLLPQLHYRRLRVKPLKPVKSTIQT